MRFNVKLSDKWFKGGYSEYLHILVFMLVFMIALILAVNTFSVISIRMKLDHFSKELVSIAATYGEIGTEVQERYDELAAVTGLNPAIDWEADYHDLLMRRVQLSEPITIRVSLSVPLSGLGIADSIVIPCTVTNTELSRKYWKND